MTYKFHHFAEDKLERWKFRNNDIAQHTVQQMVQRYEQVYPCRHAVKKKA
jgi:hypothetical protein